MALAVPSAPKKLVFATAGALAVLAMLPVIGISLGTFGAYSDWLWLVAFVLLAGGLLLDGS